MNLDLARWQFGVITVYHFLFVPITIGITWFVAVFETLWHRRKDPEYRRLARFFGNLMLINFAIGVVTGIVQEFQFGMNWSAYSRYVGDVFGAPLAMEALAAFFLESTFLGLWIFGRGRLSPRLHLATIYAVAVGTTMSAFFILAANSWMQHPVGYVIDHDTGHARMTSIFQVLTNSTLVYAFPHTIGAAVMTAGMIVVGVSAWHLARGNETEMFGRAMRLGLPVVLVASLFTTVIGHAQAQLMTEQQPMKMAAAEALYETRTSAPFSLFAVAPFEARPSRSSFDVTLPTCCRCWRPTLRRQGGGRERRERPVPGPVRRGRLPPDPRRHVLDVPDHDGHRLRADPADRLRAVARVPGRLGSSRRFLRLTTWAIALPLIANSAGWVFTEMGRQPWVVQGLLQTRDAVSPSVSAWEVGITLAGFTLLYGVLAVVDAWLMARYAKVVPEPPAEGSDEAAGGELAMAY